MVQRGFEIELEYAKQKIIDKINYFLEKKLLISLNLELLVNI